MDFKEGCVYLFNYHKNRHFEGTFVKYDVSINLYLEILFLF